MEVEINNKCLYVIYINIYNYFEKYILLLIFKGLKSIGQFTLDQIRNMIAGTESGVRYNYQGQPAREGQRTLTMGQLQRFLNEILSQGCR